MSAETIIRITAVPTPVSDDLNWEIHEDHTGTVYGHSDLQPGGVTDREYSERLLVREGVEWYRSDEDLGQGESEWLRECGRASETDSWRNEVGEVLWREFGQYDDEDCEIYPALSAGVLMTVEDDYWGDGEWSVVSIKIKEGS